LAIFSVFENLQKDVDTRVGLHRVPENVDNAADLELINLPQKYFANRIWKCVRSGPESDLELRDPAVHYDPLNPKWAQAGFWSSERSPM
jgi:hypothetical protein